MSLKKHLKNEDPFPEEWYCAKEVDEWISALNAGISDRDIQLTLQEIEISKLKTTLRLGRSIVCRAYFYTAIEIEDKQAFLEATKE